VAAAQALLERDARRLRPAAAGYLMLAVLQAIACARYPHQFHRGTVPGIVYLIFPGHGTDRRRRPRPGDAAPPRNNKGEPATMSRSALSAPQPKAGSPPAQAPATVADVMRPASEIVAEGDHAAAAASYLMHHTGTDALVVLDYHYGQPVGIITAADIARAVADGKDINQVRVHDLMATRHTPISAATPVRDAADVMLISGYRQLAVTGDGNSIGIVDIADIPGAPLSPRMNSPTQKEHPAG
jgi:CBS domain-containing protein